MINDNFDGKRPKAHNFNGTQAFKQGITWNSISSSAFHCRFAPTGFMFDAAGPHCEVTNGRLNFILGFMSSSVYRFLMGLVNPTLNFPPGYITCIPYIESEEDIEIAEQVVQATLDLSHIDWDSKETSWDFKRNPLV